MEKMQRVSFKNKLIILINTSGSYKGGAQKRYLALFSYLQRIGADDYFLLLNDSLYEACLRDKILISSKNIIFIKIKKAREKGIAFNNSPSNINSESSAHQKLILKIYPTLGLIMSYFKQLKRWAIYNLELIKIIKRLNIGLIYGVFSGGIWSWQVARLMGIKFIYSYNDASAAMIERSIFKILKSEYYVLKFADKIDFLSEGVLHKLNEKGIYIKNDKALISPNSFITYENFYPEYPKINRIVFSGRLTNFKQPTLLLEAISILKLRNFTDFTLIILGEGYLMPQLLKYKEDFNLDNVLLKGGVSDTANYLKKSKIFLSLQKDNNYPSQALLEAMSCGNAVIATDVGETRKLITESEGILVPFSAEKIADAIRFLLENTEECFRLGQNARKKAITEHNIEKYSTYFFEIVENTIS
ncbi:MAG: glycosyltransferase [Ignavibacterium sp.]|nr:glycosyltransferase [Ignavibacterium sp.]